jgi:hypothetical protein
VEFPKHLFPELSLLPSDPATINVEIVSFCPAALKVSVIPLLRQHYELMVRDRCIIHWLEQYNLLGQVSVISTHQILHIKLDLSRANDTTISTTASIIPLRVEHIMDSSFPNPCWRLVDSTELILLPPPNDNEMLSTTAARPQRLLQRIPCRQDIVDSVEMEVLEQCMKDNDVRMTTRWVHLPPKTVAIHDDTGDDRQMTRCLGIGMIRHCNHRTAIVRVLSSTHITKDCIGT